jgi:hypothetical protein
MQNWLRGNLLEVLFDMHMHLEKCFLLLVPPWRLVEDNSSSQARTTTKLQSPHS